VLALCGVVVAWPVTPLLAQVGLSKGCTNYHFTAQNLGTTNSTISIPALHPTNTGVSIDLEVRGDDFYIEWGGEATSNSFRVMMTNQVARSWSKAHPVIFDKAVGILGARTNSSVVVECSRCWTW
jgi:hypothetical protein